MRVVFKGVLYSRAGSVTGFTVHRKRNYINLHFFNVNLTSRKMCIVLNSLEHECSFKQERVVVIVDSVTMDITSFVVVCQAFSYIQ